MSTKYFALLTQLGADKLANAAALGTKIEITHMAVGDGGGSLPTPDTKQTKLINEKRRAAINTLSIDPKNTNQIISEQVIPESEGGWWIREIGLFDKDGILIAVGNCAESYKPQLQEGSGRTQTIRMILIVSSTESVTLKVDPSVVLATREYVDDSIQKHSNSRNHPDATLKEKGFVILSSAVDSNSETHAATPKAVKAAYDFANAANNNANGRVPSGRKVNGKALSEDIHLKASDVDAYNKTETDARVNDAKAQAKAANDNADGRVPAGRKVNGKALNADISLNSGDVGAYSKGETDIRVNEAKALANARLEKNQNGADIPDKDVFNRNIGSGRAFSGAISIGGGGIWTTGEFIAWLKSQGAFQHPYWMCKGTWSYASNRRITDSGCGSIHLAGAVVEVMGIEDVMTIRVTTATTSVDGCIENALFTYGNHGKDYRPGWRRDYNTVNKPTADDVNAYNKSETDSRVNAANENANTRLEKNQNGADIPNKPKFVENLGLVGTVEQARNAVPNSRKVNGKTLAGDVTLSAEDVQGEPRFNQTIDLTGLSSDRYYPVWWRFPLNERGANSWLTIHRNYAENRENKNPFGKDVTHLAGLEVQIEGSDTLWGGDAQYLNIKRINQRYRNTVKKIQYGMMSIARSVDGKYPLYYDWKSGDITECRVYSGCYLRGGLTYHVTSNFNNLDYSRKEDEVEIWHNVSDSDKREIKWTVKSYAIDDPLLGKDYDDTVLPYAHDYSETINLAKNAVSKSAITQFSGNSAEQVMSQKVVTSLISERITKSEAESKYQPKGNYAVRGESYTKHESDGKYQPRGNYQPAGNYQSAGNYAVRGECYTIKESDSRYSYKGASLSWVQVYSGRIPESGEVVDLSEDVRGRQIFIWFESWGGSNSKAYSGIFVPPVSDITLNVTESWGDSAVIRIFNNGKSLQSIRNNGALYNVFVIK
nr:phage tail protein [Xenorhabdus bovienii]